MLFQALRPQALEDPGCVPLLEAAVGGGAGADAGDVQGVPLAAGPRHEEDRIHRPPVVDPRPVPAEAVRLARGQERCEPVP